MVVSHRAWFRKFTHKNPVFPQTPGRTGPLMPKSSDPQVYKVILGFFTFLSLGRVNDVV
jgi:hypothetical protein